MQEPYLDRVPQQAKRDVEKSDTDTRTAFEEIIDRIKGGSERVIGSAVKLEVIGTRIMGALPEREPDEDAVRIEPDGTLDHALLALNRLDSSLARLESAALRLERL